MPSESASHPIGETETFPDDVVDQICKLLRLNQPRQRQDLLRALRQLPDDVRILRSADAIRHPADALRQLQRIIGACDRATKRGKPRIAQKILPDFDDAENHVGNLILYQAASLADPDRPQVALHDGRAGQILDSALEHPSKLRELVSAAEKSVDTIVARGRGGHRHKADWPLQETIYHLGTLFFDLTGRRPGVSVDPYHGEPTGDFLELLRICLPRLGWERTPEAIRHLVRAQMPDLAKLPVRTSVMTRQD